MKKIRIPNELRQMYGYFEKAGFSAYLVGGAVRDMIMGKAAHDWDIATNARPEEVSKIFKKVIPTGIAHGTVTVIFMQNHIEVTTFRTEADYSDGRHPNKIEYAGKIEEDLSRRDFTMNAIAANLKDGTLVDPFEGKSDIKKKIIRCVGEPLERFSEDGLRPVRALRFASQLGFEIDKKTLEAIPKTLPICAKVAVERFHDELIKMLISPKPSVGLKLMEKCGIMQLFLPELCACRGVEQKGFHNFDVLDHLFYSCDGTLTCKTEVRLAALFHDIAKPLVRSLGKDGTYTFYQHENESAKLTQKILDRLHFSKQCSTYVCHLIKQHMFFYESNWTDAAVRRFLMRIEYDKNAEVLNDLFDLRFGDLYGMNCQNASPTHLKEFSERIEKILQEQNAFSLKDLAVNGKDLMNLGIPAGKIIGQILAELLESVLDDPSFNQKEKLLPLAKNIYLRYQVEN